MKSIWNGSISFGLVNIPVKLYSAHIEREIVLHNLCKNGHKIEYKRWCPVEQREVEWEEIKKGFEIEKDKFVVLEKNDLEKIKLKSSKYITIDQFIDQNQIDPIEINKSYYLVPKEDEKAYYLFLKALQLNNKAAIGRLTMKNKEYVVAIRFYSNLLLLHTLYYKSEIIDTDKLITKANIEISQEELNIANEIIKKMSKDFDISKYKDEYSEALRELILSKAKGKEFVYNEQVQKVKEKDLLSSLKESLEALEKKE